MSDLLQPWHDAGEPWRPGMSGRLSMWTLFRLGDRILDTSCWNAILVTGASVTIDFRHPSLRAEPDFTDDATLGALLGVAREVYADPYLYVVRDDAWTVYARIDGDVASDGVATGPTEAEALLRAIIAGRARG